MFTTGTEVRIDFRYKHSRIKQYLKDGRALRVETVINKPDDLGVKRRLSTCASSSTRPATSTSGCL